jgi:hypothetical protein
MRSVINLGLRPVQVVRPDSEMSFELCPKSVHAHDPGLFAIGFASHYSCAKWSKPLIGSGIRLLDQSDGLAIGDGVGGGCRFRPFCGRRPRRSLRLGLMCSFGYALCHHSAAHPPPILFLSRDARLCIRSPTMRLGGVEHEILNPKASWGWHTS